MFGSSLDDDYCSDCECYSCQKKKKKYRKSYVFTQVNLDVYKRSYLINEEIRMKFAVVDSKPANRRFNFGVWHETEELAIAEAKRLCENERGLEFIVLKAIGITRQAKVPVEYIVEE